MQQQDHRRILRARFSIEGVQVIDTSGLVMHGILLLRGSTNANHMFSSSLVCYPAKTFMKLHVSQLLFSRIQEHKTVKE